MPTFKEDVEVEMSIDPEDYVEGCNEYSKNRLIDALIEDGCLNEYCRGVYQYGLLSPPEFFYVTAIHKLKNKWNMLTQEEEGLIIKIANRF